MPKSKVGCSHPTKFSIYSKWNDPLFLTSSVTRDYFEIKFHIWFQKFSFIEFVHVDVNLFPIKCSEFLNEIEIRQFIKWLHIFYTLQTICRSINWIECLFDCDRCWNMLWNWIELNVMLNPMDFIFFSISCDEPPLYLDSINHINRTFFSLDLWTSVHFSTPKKMSANKMRIGILLKSIRCCFVSFSFLFDVKSTKSLPYPSTFACELISSYNAEEIFTIFYYTTSNAVVNGKKERKRKTTPTHSLHGWNSSRVKKKHDVDIVQPHICRKHVRD